MRPEIKSAAAKALEALISGVEGDALGAAAHVADALLELVPAAVARTVVDQAAIRRANRIADIHEADRFAGEALDE